MELHRLGYLHERGVALVSRIVREESKRFRALEHLDPEDLCQDFFVARIAALTAMLLAQATSDESFGKLVRRTVRNWMIDQARATGTGPLRRSIEKVLSETALFESVPVAILEAVLQAAAGSLETAQLVHVFAQRFAAAMDPIEVPLPEHEHEDDGEVDRDADLPSEAPGPEEIVIAEEVAAETAEAAAQIVERLSVDERAILCVIDDPAEVMRRLGRGRSQSAEFARRLKVKIRELAGTGTDRDENLLAAIALCGGPQNGQTQ